MTHKHLKYDKTQKCQSERKKAMYTTRCTKVNSQKLRMECNFADALYANKKVVSQVFEKRLAMWVVNSKVC